MLPPPRAGLKPNTADFERLPLVKPTGFREYDARWLYPDEINLMGLNAVGLGIAALFAERGVPKRIVVGHDYRSYSAAVKQALVTGCSPAGARSTTSGWRCRRWPTSPSSRSRSRASPW